MTAEALHPGSHNCGAKTAEPPNMRLKLTGLSLLKEPEWLCPSGHELSFNDTPRGGLVARSLSAIR